MVKQIILMTLMIFLISWNINSQVSIKGRIVSSITGKGVEYATIHKEGTNVGIICDSVGHFELNNLKSIPDSLMIPCVGYKSKSIYKETMRTTESIVVELNEKEVLLDELIVVSDKLTKNTMTIGKRSLKKRAYSPLYYASQSMRFFNGHSFSSYIEEFSFYVGSVKGNKSARIRIYSVDSLTQMPDCDLLCSNLIIKNIKNGWNKVDLNKYRILIPEQGFYIGLESVVIDKDSWEKDAENRWVTKYRDFDLGIINENTITATKLSQLGGFEKYGERKVSPDNNKWLVFPGRGLNLPYQVKVGYYE